MKCVAIVDSKVDGVWTKSECGVECETGFKYCEDHKARKRAVNERMKAGVNALGSATPDKINFGEIQEAEIVEDAPKREVAVRVNDTSHKTIVDQVNGMLQRVVDFEFTAFNEMNKLDPGDWRYRDKNGSEQIRGEVQIYERSMDRSLRALTQITKLGIEQQAVILEKAQYLGVRTSLHKTFVRLGFDDKQISAALAIFSEEIAKLIPEG